MDAPNPAQMLLDVVVAQRNSLQNDLATATVDLLLANARIAALEARVKTLEADAVDL